MKIINQTQDEMVLKEGNVSGILFGLLLLLVGIYMGYSIYTASGYTNTLWISAALVVVGAIVMLVGSSILVTISKSGNQILYQKKRLIGSGSSTYAVADVARIETRRQWRLERSASVNGQPARSREVLVSQSFIVFKDGRELPIDHQKNAGMSVGSLVTSGQNGEVAVSNQVATFLGVPYQEIAPPDSGIGLPGIQL